MATKKQASTVKADDKKAVKKAEDPKAKAKTTAKANTTKATATKTAAKKTTDESTEEKKVVNNGKTYVLSKRKEDGMWALKYIGGERVIKLFKTQKEALEFTKTRAENNDRAIVVRASKGAHKGKFQK